jgi:hypothetical protein
LIIETIGIWKVSKTVTATERISSSMREKTKIHIAREGRESQDKPSDDERVEITAREDEEFV